MPHHQQQKKPASGEENLITFSSLEPVLCSYCLFSLFSFSVYYLGRVSRECEFYTAISLYRNVTIWVRTLYSFSPSCRFPLTIVHKDGERWMMKDQKNQDARLTHKAGRTAMSPMLTPKPFASTSLQSLTSAA